MTVTIPFQPAAAFKQSVTLDGGEYVLSFYWNTRGEFWSMNIADANENMIISGIRLTIGYPLKIQHPQLTLPPGEFIIIDKSEKTFETEPGRDDFVEGRNLELQYIEAAA